MKLLLKIDEGAPAMGVGHNKCVQVHKFMLERHKCACNVRKSILSTKGFSDLELRKIKKLSAAVA